MLRVAFWKSEIAKGLGEAASASKEPQKVSDSGGARQKVFKSHSSTAYLHLQSSSFHLVCQAHKDKVVYSLIAGSAIGARGGGRLPYLLVVQARMSHPNKHLVRRRNWLWRQAVLD